MGQGKLRPSPASSMKQRAGSREIQPSTHPPTLCQTLSFWGHRNENLTDLTSRQAQFSENRQVGKEDTVSHCGSLYGRTPPRPGSAQGRTPTGGPAVRGELPGCQAEHKWHGSWGRMCSGQGTRRPHKAGNWVLSVGQN